MGGSPGATSQIDQIVVPGARSRTSRLLTGKTSGWPHNSPERGLLAR